MILSCLLLGRDESSGDYGTRGRWTTIPTTDSTALWDGKKASGSLDNGGGTHLALLRGNSDGTTDSAWVIHWHSGLSARLWLAKPELDVTRGIAVGLTPPDTANLFCAGHSTLPDGRLLVVGGTRVGVTGLARAHVFNPKAYGPNSGQMKYGWSIFTKMTYGRWYPTQTTLGNGKILVTSGYNHDHMVTFGGYNSDSAMSDLRALKSTDSPDWNRDPTFPDTVRPAAREGHTMSFHRDHGALVVLGGMVFGTPADTVSLDPVYLGYRGESDYGIRWKWEKLATLPDSANGRPAGRARHTTVMLGDSLYLYGGITKNSLGNMTTVLTDLWLLPIDRNLAPSRWKKLTGISGSPPSLRYGHTAVLDPGPRGTHWAHPRMLLYGGKSGINSYANGSVYQLTIPRYPNPSPDTLKWTVVSTDTTPGKRDGHAAEFEGRVPRDRPNGTKRSMLVFGGRKITTGRDSSLWALTRSDPDTAAPDSVSPTWTWRLLKPSSGSIPAGRNRHTITHDSQFDRLFLFGGDTNTDSTSGGFANDLWTMDLAKADKSDTLDVWTLRSVAPGDTVPVVRGGHASIFDTRPVFATVPERIDPADSTTQELTSAEKRISLYPFMYVMRSGKIFYGGNGPEENFQNSISWILSSGASPTWSDTAHSGFTGGSSVFVRRDTTDRIMKCGGDDEKTTGEQTTAIARVDTTSGATQWIPGQPMLEARVYHNLTILPSGKVLLSGGGDGANDRQIPRLWDPVAQGWGVFGDSLAKEIFPRRYHSTALLLPDGRVLSASGPSGGNPNEEISPATIFWPPYLFKPGTDSLATRPIITGMQGTAHYREPIYVSVNVSTDNIATLCLLKAGSVTHAFNQDQRYVKLPFTRVHSRLRAVLPDSNVAPPGNYLCFALDNAGVPAVAKWLGLNNEVDTNAPGAVSDFEAAMSSNTAVLSWSSAGDDGGTGTATSQEVRYSTQAINESNWSSATLISSAVPKPGTEGESLTVTGLSSCTWYYFGIKTRDEWGNSNLSTISGKTLCGGVASNRVVVGPEVVPLSSVETSASSMQIAMHWLSNLRGPQEHGYSVSLAHVGSGGMRIDSVAIVAIDHGPDSLAWSGSGGMRFGVRQAARRVVSPSGADLTSRVTGSGSYAAAAGETLTVQLESCASPGACGLILDVLGCQDDSRGGVRVEELSLVGRDLARGEQLTGRLSEALVFDGLTSDSLRLIFTAPRTIRFIGQVRAIETPPLTLPIGPSRVVVTTSEGGVIERSKLGSAILGAGDRLDVAFEASPPSGARVRDPFLVVYGGAGALPPSSQKHETTTNLPRVFALRQNQPNPFSSLTTMRFDVPVTTQVSLEIFDVQGRRMQILARKVFKPGYHALTWDRRQRDGSRAAPGVYLYRLTAGSFQADRKLVILP